MIATGESVLSRTTSNCPTSGNASPSSAYSLYKEHVAVFLPVITR